MPATMDPVRGMACGFAKAVKPMLPLEVPSPLEGEVIRIHGVWLSLFHRHPVWVVRLMVSLPPLPDRLGGDGPENVQLACV